MMATRILITSVIVFSLLLPGMAQDTRSSQDDVKRPAGELPVLIDPGFESFRLAAEGQPGWFSADLLYPNDPKYGEVKMTPDDQIKVEGRYSLRIEQTRTRAKNQGQAFLAQIIPMPKGGGGARNFNLAVQMRGAVSGPVTIQLYVWEPEWMARIIADRNVKIDRDWKTTTIKFRVPLGFNKFGIWFYLPRDNEAELWLDDIRLTPR
jgi:hypothetical protein